MPPNSLQARMRAPVFQHPDPAFRDEEVVAPLQDQDAAAAGSQAPPPTTSLASAVITTQQRQALQMQQPQAIQLQQVLRVQQHHDEQVRAQQDGQAAAATASTTIAEETNTTQALDHIENHLLLAVIVTRGFDVQAANALTAFRLSCTGARRTTCHLAAVHPKTTHFLRSIHGLCPAHRKEIAAVWVKCQLEQAVKLLEGVDGLRAEGLRHVRQTLGLSWVSAQEVCSALIGKGLACAATERRPSVRSLLADERGREGPGYRRLTPGVHTTSRCESGGADDESRGVTRRQ